MLINILSKQKKLNKTHIEINLELIFIVYALFTY